MECSIEEESTNVSVRIDDCRPAFTSAAHPTRMIAENADYAIDADEA